VKRKPRASRSIELVRHTQEKGKAMKFMSFSHTPTKITPSRRLILRIGATIAILLLIIGGGIALLARNSNYADAASTALSRSGWTATASSIPTDSCCTGDIPTNALDGKASTRWSTGVAQATNQWFQVDMKTAKSFNSISLDAGSSKGDYPHGYKVYASNSKSNWGSTIASGRGTSQSIKISFATQSARYIKVVQTGSSDNWWSIQEFNVYSSAGVAPTNTSTKATATSTSATATPTTGSTKPTPTSTSGGTTSGGQRITGVYITWYGFNDNSCDVESQHNCNTIAFPKSDGFSTKHDMATEGKGTYADPITFATAAKDSGSPAEFAPGTIIYVPYVHKYFVMEDSCYECGQEWFTNSPKYHVDLWMGPSFESTTDPLMNCEDSLTLDSGVIIVNPPTNLTTDTSPLFTNNSCTAHTYSNS
jgi:F5/8 type C domain